MQAFHGFFRANRVEAGDFDLCSFSQQSAGILVTHHSRVAPWETTVHDVNDWKENRLR